MTKCYNCKHKFSGETTVLFESVWPFSVPVALCDKNPTNISDLIDFYSTYSKCKDKNDGFCHDYKKSLRARLFGERP